MGEKAKAICVKMHATATGDTKQATVGRAVVCITKPHARKNLASDHQCC